MIGALVAEDRYFSRKDTRCRANIRNELPEPVLEPQLVEIDAVVGILDVGVRHVL